MEPIDLDRLPDGRGVTEVYRLAGGILLAVLVDGQQVVIDSDGTLIETPKVDNWERTGSTAQGSSVRFIACQRG